MIGIDDLLIFGGVAAIAFLLSGCNQSEKSSTPADSGSGDAGITPPSSSSSSSAFFPPPKAPFKILLNGSERALKAYEALKKAGVTDEDFDTGCSLVKSPAPGRIIGSCEVFQYALQHHQKFPLIAQEAAGGPLPWVLDAGDENGQKVRQDRKSVV